MNDRVRFPLEESSYSSGVKSSHYQEEPAIPDLNRGNENLQLFCLLLQLGLWKAKGSQKTANVKKTHNKVWYKEMFRPYEILPFVLSLALGVSWHWVLPDVQ